MTLTKLLPTIQALPRADKLQGGATACRLCDKEKPLQQSHVVPEFFYKPIYDEKHRIYPRIGGRLASMPPLQKGLREPLLCWDCEQILSRYEKYNREVLYGGVETSGSIYGDRIVLSDLDYQKVRVFYLSVLWRMSIATHQAWKDVQLGPHESRVKRLVHDQSPGSPDDYGFVCIAPLFDGQVLADQIHAPDYVCAYGGRFYRIVLGGFLFLFFVADVPFPTDLAENLIQPNGKWVIPIRNAWDIEFIREEAKRLAEKR